MARTANDDIKLIIQSNSRQDYGNACNHQPIAKLRYLILNDLENRKVECLILNLKVLGSNSSLPDERSKRETSRGIGFCSIYSVILLANHNISLYVYCSYILYIGSTYLNS